MFSQLVLLLYFITSSRGNDREQCESFQVYDNVEINEKDDDICNVPRVNNFNSFQSSDLPNIPFVISYNLNISHKLKELVDRQNLLDNYGREIVQLTSSNTYSHGLVEMTLENYIINHIDNNNLLKNANETLYLFGNNYELPLFRKMVELYNTPPCKYCEVAGLNSFGIGGENSGVSFHFHGPGFSETLIGRKKWFLFPPHYYDNVPRFQPNMTVYDWYHNNLPLVDDVEALADLQQCTLQPGEYLYFPDRWMHATLNLDSYNFFSSLFLDTQLIKN
jgi:hypothetical protein